MLFTSTACAARTGGEVAASLHHYREQVLDQRRRTAVQRAQQPSVSDFYKGRSVFITGGSGFLGRMIIEHLLWTCPDIDKIYLVLRTKRGKDPISRSQSLFDVPLFDRLRAKLPDALSKVVALPGDITELGLGLSREHQDLVREKVSVVFNLAASVRFDEPFQKAVFTNVRSTREVVELARGMPQLKAMVHVSTAYTNTNRDPAKTVEETVYPTHLDWRSAIRMAEEMDAASLWAMDCLGPNLRGYHPNSYTFSKALAEKLIDDVADELPVIIVRPSIVMPTFKDPMPGWIDNLYGLNGFMAGALKGLIRVTHSKEDVSFNSVPGDLVTKNTILASWARGINLSINSSINLSINSSINSSTNSTSPVAVRKSKSVEVLHATVPGSAAVGFSYKDMEWWLQADKLGYRGVVRDPKYAYAENYLLYLVLHWYHHILYASVLDVAARLIGKKPRLLKIYRNTVIGLAAIKPFMANFKFALENQSQLQALMHPKDEEAYCILDFCSVRDNVEVLTGWCYSSSRGVLVNVLQEKDSFDNIKQVSRPRIALKFYQGAIAALVGILSVFTVMAS